MATNIEIKAKVGDAAGLKERIERICHSAGEVLLQEDTFFHTQRGRLKLRVVAPGPRAQLIYYERTDIKGPKRSDYIVVEIDDPAGLEVLLAAVLGVRGKVCKTRRLYFLGRTRIHLNEVEGLGSFMELEVVTDPGRDAPEGNAGGGKAAGEKTAGGEAPWGKAASRKTAGGKSVAEKATKDGETEAAALMEKLGIRETDLVDGAYIDLLEARRNREH